MLQILFAGRDLASLPAFKIAIEESNGQVTCLESGQQVLDAVSRGTDPAGSSKFNYANVLE